MTLNIWWVYQPKSHRKPNLFQMVQMKRCEWKHYWERSGLRQHPKTSTSRTSYRTETERWNTVQRPCGDMEKLLSRWEGLYGQASPRQETKGKNTQLFSYSTLWLPDRVSQQLHPRGSQQSSRFSEHHCSESRAELGHSPRNAQDLKMITLGLIEGKTRTCLSHFPIQESDSLVGNCLPVKSS